MRRTFCYAKLLYSRGLRLVAAIRLERIAHDAPALVRDAPTAAARDFANHAAYLQALQQATHGSAMTVPERVLA